MVGGSACRRERATHRCIGVGVGRDASALAERSVGGSAWVALLRDRRCAFIERTTPDAPERKLPSDALDRTLASDAQRRIARERVLPPTRRYADTFSPRRHADPPTRRHVSPYSCLILAAASSSAERGEAAICSKLQCRSQGAEKPAHLWDIWHDLSIVDGRLQFPQARVVLRQLLVHRD